MEPGRWFYIDGNDDDAYLAKFVAFANDGKFVFYHRGWFFGFGIVESKDILSEASVPFWWNWFTPRASKHRNVMP